MGQVCCICSHVNKVEIERSILQGTPKGKIASAYGVPEHAVRNHAANHLSRQIVQSHRGRELMNTERLLDDLEQMRSRIITILDRAERADHLVTELKAIAEWRATLQFLTGLAIDLRRLDNEEQRQEQHMEVETLKNRLSRIELETLHTLLTKANGEDDSSGELLAARWSGKSLPYYDLHERPAEEDKPAEEAEPTQRFPRIRI
jgi:hypothetical protein